MSGEKLYVRNWAKFQHYKKRKPPWIKLHTDTYQNEDFARLSENCKVLLMGIWTLASRATDGSLSDHFPTIRRQLCLSSRIKLRHLRTLIANGFLELESVHASKMLAERKHTASNMLSPETETEKEQERVLSVVAVNSKSEIYTSPNTNSRSAKKPNARVPEDFEALWTIWPRHEAKGKCLEIYQRHSLGQPNGLILERARKQVELWREQQTDTQYIPMLRTWLNQKRYDTEPEFIGRKKETLEDVILRAMKDNP